MVTVELLRPRACIPVGRMPLSSVFVCRRALKLELPDVPFDDEVLEPESLSVGWAVLRQ